MSAETTNWLNRFTLQSAKAWHTSEQLQKVYGTVYDGAIPVDDVATRLFGWTPLEGPLMSSYTDITADGVETVTVIDPTSKNIIRPRGALGEDYPAAILGTFKQGYKIHGYKEWLLDNVASLLDDGLGIYSAGLLKGGAQGWVQVTVPETITTPEGVTFRPNLLAVTSLDGSLATTYKRTVSNAVCDNTMSLALSEVGQQYKIKHSRYSDVKLMDARNALAMVHQIADEFSAEVAALCATTVTDSQFDAFLSEIAPKADAQSGALKTGRAATIAQNRWDAMKSLWASDARVAPWKNTAYGVLQAENTYAHHVGTVKGDRDERNMSMAVSGGFDKLDNSTLATLAKVLQTA
jgi:phage/plasmid-like protein (TIGR03299 family)